MRKLLRALGVAISGLMIVVAVPGWAGIRATYVAGSPQAKPLDARMTITIRDADNDRTDIEMGGELVASFIRRDRETFIAQKDGATWIVMRESDILAMTRGQAGPNPSSRRYGIVDLGPATVGGRKGQRYGLRSDEDKSASEPDFQVVTSSDTTLGPLGRVMARQMSGPQQAMTDMMPWGGNLDEGAATILLSGTILRVGDLTLDKVETVDIPPATFVLPGRILSPNEVKALLAPPAPGAPSSGGP